jgi:hypothetical protein
MWAVMSRFGHETLPDELNGSKIHRLENVMTLENGFHTLFDQLEIWFVPTVRPNYICTRLPDDADMLYTDNWQNEENKYMLDSTTGGLFARSYPKYVKFETPDPVKYPVPSAEYLGLHAACAKVAHLSGAGECIDRFSEGWKDGQTLDPNGGSADVLEQALFELQVAA